MPSTTSSSVSSDLASSTVMTPSLPTFFIASASIWPISASPLAEIVPTWAISSLVDTGFARFLTSATIASTAMSMPRFRSIGFIPAATARTPSRTIACARIVAVVGAVARLGAGLGRDFLDHLRAHVLELVAKFDFLGDGNAVLGDARRAERFVENDVAALGSERHAHRLGQDVDAAQHALAGIGTVSDVFGSHDYSISIIRAARASSASGSDDAHDVGFFHDDQFLAVELDLGAGPFAEQHPVSGLDVEGCKVPSSPRAPGPTATISPSIGFSWAVSGMMIPPRDFSS